MNEYAKMINLFNKFLSADFDELQAITDIAVTMSKLVQMKENQIKLATRTLENIKDCLYQMDNILCYRRICKITMDE